MWKGKGKQQNIYLTYYFEKVNIRSENVKTFGKSSRRFNYFATKGEK